MSLSKHGLDDDLLGKQREIFHKASLRWSFHNLPILEMIVKSGKARYIRNFQRAWEIILHDAQFCLRGSID